ncbi:MAG: YjbQ family protein [Chloroflexi bacterium]|nr:YjbQ family protein [Chloroflexota bacterium]
MIREFRLSTPARTAFLDITAQIEGAVRDSGVRSGVCHVFVPHTTAGITINENADPSVRQDLLATLSRLVPANGPYRHLEGNADAHVKASLVGSSVTLFIQDGRLIFGTWQGVYFCEFDGPRQRQVLVRVIPDPGEH